MTRPKNEETPESQTEDVSDPATEPVEDNVVEIVEPLDPIAVLEEKCAQSEKDLLYLKAEFENYKRNAIKERAQLIKFGAQRFALDLLDTVDVFAQAFDGEVTEENYKNFVDGIKMTQQQMLQTLSKHGIVKVDALGKNFDPATQEALGAQPTDEFAAGQVCQVFKAPFMYHDKLLRAGQVFVASEVDKSKS